MARCAWLGVAIVLLAVGSGCTPQGPLVRAAASPSPSAATPEVPTPAQSPQATPSVQPTAIPVSVDCSAALSAAGQPFAASWNPDRTEIVLDTLQDPLRPATLCTIRGAYNVRFISSMDIGFVTNPSSNDPIHSTSTIWRANLFNHMRVALAEVQGMVMDVAWSPDESSVAYLVYTDAPGMVSGSAHQLWLKAGKAPARALTPLIPLFGRGGSLDDQTIVRFSHDGKYLLMVDTYVAGGPPATPDQAIVQVHSVPDGSLVFVPPSALSQPGNKFFYYVTMAAWSHQTDRLYYRDRDGVQVWEPNMYSTQKTIAAGLNWFLPSISPGDRFVAYVVTEGGSSLSQPHVEVRDLATNAVRVIPGIRAAPFFVSDTLLLVAEYGPNPEQGPGPSYVPTGKGFFFDVRTNVETQTKEVISPIDYWPH